MGRYPRRMDRDSGSVEYFDAMVLASAKIYLLLSEKCMSFSSVVSSVHFSLTFSYAIITCCHSLA